MKHSSIKKVLITGANGFIGKNLAINLKEDNIDILTFLRGDSDDLLMKKLKEADIVVHLAGENRPNSSDMFERVNVGLTAKIAEHLININSDIPIIFASSTQAQLNNLYGRSKLNAENLLEDLSMKNGNPVSIYRLPGVFGKWCRPNYNSVVATFSYNVANGLPIKVNDPKKILQLVYIDDVIKFFKQTLHYRSNGVERKCILPEYKITLEELANQIQVFDNCRSSLKSEKVGSGITRALYSTYVSYLPVERFSYEIPYYSDERGVFAEMIKTLDSGQFSFFTAFFNSVTLVALDAILIGTA